MRVSLFLAKFFTGGWGGGGCVKFFTLFFKTSLIEVKKLDLQSIALNNMDRQFVLIKYKDPNWDL